MMTHPQKDVNVHEGPGDESEHGLRYELQPETVLCSVEDILM